MSEYRRIRLRWQTQRGITKSLGISWHFEGLTYSWFSVELIWRRFVVVTMARWVWERDFSDPGYDDA